MADNMEKANRNMPLLLEEDLKLLESVEAAYQALDYPKASSLIPERLNLDNIDPSTRVGALLLLQLACLLIDISKARNLRVDAEEGLDILERNLEVFQKIVSPSNLHTILEMQSIACLQFIG